jgi:type VI protein secretion system component VasK
VRLTRFALGAGVVVVVAFMLLVAIGMHGAFTPIIAILALGGLIACGNLLYGKHSHGAAATARVRPAQEAQNRAIDETQEQARLARQQARQQRQQVRRRWGGSGSGRQGGSASGSSSSGVGGGQ